MAEEGAVRVTTSEEGPVVRRLEIEVDPKRVRRAFDRAYRDLAKRARVKGFRAGKAPRSVLEKMFGPQVREEIERLLVSESLPEAVEEAGVRPVAEPSIDAQAPEEDAPFRYTAEIEVKPTIALPTLEGLPASQPAVAGKDRGKSQFAFTLEFHETSWPAEHPCELPVDIYQKLLEGLTARVGNRKLFSIIGADNVATQKMALRNQTKQVATFYSKDLGKEIGVWIPVWMLEN